MGRMKVQDVKRPDVAALMKKLAHKPAEANRTFGVLRKMFNLAEVGAASGRHKPVPPRPDVSARQGNPAHRGR